MDKIYSDLLDKPIVYITVDEGSYSTVYNTSLKPKDGVQWHDLTGDGVQDVVGYPVSKIEVVYVPGEYARVPWFNVYVGDTLFTTINGKYVREVSSIGFVDMGDLFPPPQ